MKETWKDIKGYEGSYQVSNLGRVRSLDRMVKHKKEGLRKQKGLTLKNRKDYGGYYKVLLCKNGQVNNQKISRLVAQAFISNPRNKTQVNHKNGIKTDNKISNLEWCTRSENSKHAYKTGLIISVKGENHGRSKLNEKQVRVIKHALKFNIKGTAKQLTKMMNVSEHTISLIKYNKNWKHIKI